jgi:alkaline phosphatase D
MGISNWRFTKGLAYCLVAAGMALAAQSGRAQAPALVSAPILGAQTPQSAQVWAMVRDCKAAELRVGGRVYSVATDSIFGWQGHIPVKFQVDGLSAGGTVEGQLWLDGVTVGAPFTIAAAPATPQAEWSFQVGSCAFYGVGATGLIKPGRHVQIFDAMLAQPSDMMVWLGDNVYLLNGEWNDDARMYEKYTKVRLEPHTNAFLRSRPQYAILDDHDYGPDNAEGDFDNKAATMACFKAFWPNPYFGEAGAGGTYYHFDYQDASFFMLDDRWFRITEGNKQILGSTQLEWLKQGLKASRSTFKFIALGSQVISEANAHETWSRFAERQALFDFIQAERITGVIFLSGDRHFTELCRVQPAGMYPLYDFTSSPISSILRKQVGRPKDVEYTHPLRVEGTKVVAHNFGKVTIHGPQGARICRLETYDAYGKLLWSHAIPQTELDWQP